MGKDDQHMKLPLTLSNAGVQNSVSQCTRHTAVLVRSAGGTRPMSVFLLTFFSYFTSKIGLLYRYIHAFPSPNNF
jgi:hypothetical protein